MRMGVMGGWSPCRPWLTMGRAASPVLREGRRLGRLSRTGRGLGSEGLGHVPRMGLAEWPLVSRVLRE
jgi:hypothetical protein